MERYNNMLVIVGVPRSGTTLLQSLMNRSRDIIIAPETHYFVNECHRESSAKEALKSWCKINEHLSLGIERPELERLALKSKNPTDLFLSAIQRYAELRKPEATHYGEKTPGNYEYLCDIIEAFPGVKIIWVLRDPRAIAASYKSVPWNQRGEVIGVALRIRKSHKYYKYVSSFYNDVYSVKYEQLVENPSKVLDSVGKRMGLSRLSELIEMDSKKIETSYNEKWHNEHIRRAGSAIDRKSLLKWSVDLTSTEIMLVESYCAAYMRYHGYKETIPINYIVIITETIRFFLRNKRIMINKLS